MYNRNFIYPCNLNGSFSRSKYYLITNSIAEKQAKVDAMVLNGDMEESIENVVFYSSIDTSKIDEYFDKKVREYAKNNLIDTRYYPIDPHFNKDTKNLEGLLLKHLVRIYWSCIVNFYNVEDINIHFRSSIL
jgi:hypothetical protein